MKDWYERRHELKPGMIFKTHEGSIVQLDRRVPGDGTKWYVLDYYNGVWAYEGGILEPGALKFKLKTPR